MRLFTDRDVGSAELAEALEVADVFFGSLVFDYDQVAWLTPRLERVPTRFVFESALELMSSTRVGSSKPRNPRYVDSIEGGKAGECKAVSRC